MQAFEAAQRWANTWASAWPRKDVEAIVNLQADEGEHWASMFQPFHGRSGLRSYLVECFAEETKPAKTWFADPVVEGGTASVEYWVVIYIRDQPTTVSGCTVLAFDEFGLVKVARDYSDALEGHHAPDPSVRALIGRGQHEYLQKVTQMPLKRHRLGIG